MSISRIEQQIVECVPYQPERASADQIKAKIRVKFGRTLDLTEVSEHLFALSCREKIIRCNDESSYTRQN